MAENGEIRPPRPNSPGNPRGAARGISRLLGPRRIPRAPGRGVRFHGEFAGQFPGEFHWKSDSASETPGDFPGVGISREIPREVGRDSRLPGKLPGESVAADFGGSPRKLIAVKSGISARRRRSGGPQPQVLTSLDAIPASPRVGAGVSGPRESAGPHGTGIQRISPVAFPELGRPDF